MNWLKALGMGAREQQMPDDWTRYHGGFFLKAATFGRQPRSVARSDGIVYYASGTGLVFAAGAVTSYPYRVEEDWTPHWPWRVDVSMEASREYIHDGIPLEEMNVDERDLRRSIKRHSHIRLSDAEFAAALELLR